MKLSICVTYYNQEKYVKDSLDSILSIKFPCDVEILCGDDGSSDKTLDVIKVYAKQYNFVKYYTYSADEHRKSINRASLNRINLLSKATGDYIMFLDGDDFYCNTDFINKALSILTKDNSLSACAFNFKYHFNDKDIIYNQNMKEGRILSQYYIKKSFYTPAGACVFRNIFDEQKIQFLYKVKHFDDNVITIYMLQFGDLYYISDVIHSYRQSQNSLWNMLNETEKNFQCAIDFILISKLAPIYKNDIFIRQFGSFKFLFRNRLINMKFLSNSQIYQRNYPYIKENLLLDKILHWNSLNFLGKLKTYFWWYITKLNIKLHKFF